ncbi:MAG: hypothetical protein H8E18_09675 [FCB group bacterium]|nr:hypothetical protein [FCB group bacterium]
MAGRDIIKPTYIIGSTTFGGQAQLDILYQKLKSESEESELFTGIIDELLHYKEYARNSKVIGLDKKLEDGERQNYLEFAKETKERFAKKLLRNEHSETAQRIFAFLLAKVYTSFQSNIYPQVNQGHPEEYINQLILEHIVRPLENILGENLMRIYDDEINGMIYFLTGNCHIKWS